MVAQHSHLSMRIILRPQKFVPHSCEYTQRCTMLVLMIVRPSAIESVAHGHSEFQTCSKIRHDRRRAENRMQRKRQLMQRWQAISLGESWIKHELEAEQGFFVDSGALTCPEQESD